jgi:hypothetical protein
MARNEDKSAEHQISAHLNIQWEKGPDGQGFAHKTSLVKIHVYGQNPARSQSKQMSKCSSSRKAVY